MSAIITRARVTGVPASTLKAPTGAAVLMAKKKFKDSAGVSIHTYYFLLYFYELKTGPLGESLFQAIKTKYCALFLYCVLIFIKRHRIRRSDFR